ncbi:MAG TPA: hypothetical protein VGL88_02565 [Pseudonocardiaceae bacterium]|jgi:hypothetical protein
MRIAVCGLIAGAALLGPVPVAMADTAGTTANASTVQNQAAPQAEVSMLAVLFTAGGAVATAGSGVALVLTRRRMIRRPSSQASG